MAKTNPAQFMREVRQEIGKVTWPTRKETFISGGLVLAVALLTGLFFMLVDTIIGKVIQGIFGFNA